MKEKILKLRKEGKTYNEIKKILGCAKSTISYHCTKNEITEENLIYTIDNISLEIQNNVIKLRKEEKTYEEIYKIINGLLTKENIRLLCNKNGLSYLDRLSDNDIIKLRELYIELKSTRKVAKMINTSKHSVSKYVQDLMNKTKQTKEERKKSVSKGVVNWRKRTKIELVEYKGGKCEKCGYNKCVKALTFHHLDPKEKDFTISGKSWSVERLKKEVDKCIMVCSNCHIEIHAEIEENKILASTDPS